MTSPAETAVATSDVAPFVETARFVGHAFPWVEAVRASPDGTNLLTSSGDRTARLWDIATGRELHRFWHPKPARPIAFHPSGTQIITGCDDGIVRLWDIEAGKAIRELSKLPGPVQALAISPDGLNVLAGGESNTLRLLEIETGKTSLNSRAFRHRSGVWRFRPTARASWRAGQTAPFSPPRQTHASRSKLCRAIQEPSGTWRSPRTTAMPSRRVATDGSSTGTSIQEVRFDRSSSMISTFAAWRSTPTAGM